MGVVVDRFLPFLQPDVGVAAAAIRNLPQAQRCCLGCLVADDLDDFGITRGLRGEMACLCGQLSAQFEQADVIRSLCEPVLGLGLQRKINRAHGIVSANVACDSGQPVLPASSRPVSEQPRAVGWAILMQECRRQPQ
jgi:hypothetical protein